MRQKNENGDKKLLRKGDFPAHYMIAKTAKEIARATYEDWASKSDEFYRENRSIEEYAEASWPMFVQAARATLAKMLTSSISDDLKNTISDALIQDNALRLRRAGKVLQAMH